jgi:hypothetical protein
MLGISLASAKELADLDIARPTAGRDIRLVPDKHVPGVRIAAAEELPSPLGLRYSSLISTAIHHSCRLPLSDE